jgi:SAM-dependent methyltransferase
MSVSQPVGSLNSSRLWLEREVAAFATSLPAGSKVLDAGAGEAPYKPHFKHCIYETADFMAIDKPYVEQTYVCDLSSIPVEGGRFDAVLFNQVLEHVPDPKSVLLELRRVLNDEGMLLFSAPFYFEEHEAPYDFYRYTQFGIGHLFAEAGFDAPKPRWLEGYFGTAAYQLENMARHLPARPSKIVPGWRGIVVCPAMLVLRQVFRLSATVFQRIDARKRFTAAGHPKNYFCVVRVAAITN